MKSVRTFLSTISDYCFYLLVFFPPLIILPLSDRYDLPKYLVFSLLASGILIVYGILITQGWLTLKVNRTFWRLLLLFVWSQLISFLFSIHRLTSLLGQKPLYIDTLGYFLLMATLSLLFQQWLKKNRQRRLLALAVCLTMVGLLVSSYSLIEVVRLPEKFATTMRLRGIIGEPNRLGLYLAALFPFASVLLLQSKKSLKLLGLVTLLLVLFNIVFSFSRSAWLALPLGLTVFALFTRKRSLRFLRSSTKRLLVLILFIPLIITVVSPLKSRVVDRITVLKQDVATGGGSLFIRLSEWQTALRAYSSQPLGRKMVGTGQDTAIYYLLQHRDPKINLKLSPKERQWRTYKVLNEYFNLLLNQGLFGLASYLSVILLSLWQLRPRLASLTLTEQGFLASFLIIVISGFVYYQTPLTGLVFWLALASFWKPNLHVKGTSSKVVAGLLLSGGLLSLILTLILGTGNFLSTAGKYAQATRLAPWNDAHWREWTLHELHLAQMARLQDPQDHTGNLRRSSDNAVAYARQAFALNPQEVNNVNILQASLYRRGVFLDKTAHQEAIVLGKQLVVLDPTHATPYDNLGLTYLDLGLLDEAIVNFKRAIELDPDYKTSYLHLGEAYKQKGDYETALSYYRTAVERFPNYDFAKEELKKGQQLPSE